MVLGKNSKIKNSTYNPKQSFIEHI